MMRLVLLCLLVGCASSPPDPKATGTMCPDPDPMTLTWDNFGQSFMANYCTMCHASTLTHSQRNGAPLYHDYDSLRGVLEIPGHIDEDAGNGPDASNTRMPPSKCPSTPGGSLDRDCARPSDAERTNLSLWLACEQLRPH